MSNLESLTNDLHQLEAGYYPKAEVRQALLMTDMVALIGPFAVGKTSVMECAQELDEEFGTVVSFTTRPPRPGESPAAYNFRPHDEASLTVLRDKAQAGKLVQLAVHPTTGYVYGSELQAYHKPYNMLDMLPSGVPGLAALPFRQLHMVGITVPPDVWLERFQGRSRYSGGKEIQARLHEGVANIEWSLDRSDMRWVVNGRRDIADTARQMIDMVRRPDEVLESESQAREVALALHATMQDLLKN